MTYVTIFENKNILRERTFKGPFFDASGNKKNRCYYPHLLRDSISPVCGIIVSMNYSWHVWELSATIKTIKFINQSCIKHKKQNTYS